MSFTYCLNTSTIRPTPLLNKIRLAGQAGFTAIEPWNDEISAYLSEGGTLAELKSALADANLKVVSMICVHGWANAEGDAYQVALDDARRRMDQAAALESPYIVASPPDEVVDIGRTTERYGQLLRIGRQAGVKPSMEFLGFVQGIKSMTSALAIAEGTCDPDATVVADVFHLIRGGGTVDDLLLIKGKQLACFHINDIPATPDPLTQSDADRVLPGDGIADLPRVIANLRTIGYQGPLSLELFNPSLWDADPLNVIRSGLDRIRALVEA